MGSKHINVAAFREHLDTVYPFTRGGQRFAAYDYCKSVILQELSCFPAANVVEAPQWHPVSDPPKTSGRYIVWCDQWGGWNMRMCNYLQSVKEWHDDCGHDVTVYVKKWTDKPKPPKEYET